MEIKYSKLTTGQLVVAISLNALMFFVFYTAYSTAYHIERNPLEVVSIR